ncbi:MAG: endonuclease/exonuclease/phosphatase family protein [Candidatus Azobacteroides sp.]|nr:endonuclease/exonuclease/phosphatase family protein [Candidatus Azobacteroides sp.]
MKYHYYIFLFLAITICGTGEAQNKKLIPYSIAFYNLENLFDTINSNGNYDLEYSPAGDKKWDGKKYQAKLNNMAKVISLLGKEVCPYGPAVIGVAEVENRQVLEDLVKTGDLAPLNLAVVHYDSPDIRGVDVGLLYNPQMFTVTSSQSYRLTIPEQPEFRTRDPLLVSGLLDGEKFHFIVNHWPSRRNGEKASRYLRVAAANLNKQIHDSIRNADPEAKVIIMGDLNDDPTNESVKKVLNAKAKKKDTDVTELFNPMADFFSKGIGTIGYQGKWSLFDQILLSGNMLSEDRTTFQFWKAEIFNRNFLIQKEGQYKGYPLRTHSGNLFLNGYSDHFPVLVYLIKYYKGEEK